MSEDRYCPNCYAEVRAARGGDYRDYVVGCPACGTNFIYPGEALDGEPSFLQRLRRRFI